MSHRTLVILLAAVVVGAVTFMIGRQFHHTLLFVPLFLFWSWGERGRPKEVVVENDTAFEPRLRHTDAVDYWQHQHEDGEYRYPERPHQPQAS